MKQKKSRRKILKPRIPVWKIKPEQTHRSQKDYRRQRAKKEIRQIVKEESAS